MESSRYWNVAVRHDGAWDDYPVLLSALDMVWRTFELEQSGRSYLFHFWIFSDGHIQFWGS